MYDSHWTLKISPIYLKLQQINWNAWKYEVVYIMYRMNGSTGRETAVGLCNAWYLEDFFPITGPFDL